MRSTFEQFEFFYLKTINILKPQQRPNYTATVLMARGKPSTKFPRGVLVQKDIARAGDGRADGRTDGQAYE